MKRTLILLLTLCLSLSAQSNFCDGWEDGYAAGKKSENDNTYITPICPIAKIGQDTYQSGYNLGFEKATGKSSTAIQPEENSNGDAFCNGWEKGFTAAMEKNNKSIYIVPICPIPRMNEDSYDDGFAKGYQKGLDKLGVDKDENIIVPNETGKDFCDGWERGYQYGLQEWATDNNKSKPSKMTPICPIPKLNQDTYSNGFELGKEKAKKDMED